MVCEAIGGERKELHDLKPDENGLYDIRIQLNGKELNVERFLENLYRSYCESVKEQASNLLNSEYSEILNTIYDIQQSLENHNKIFDEKIYGFSDE